MHHPSDSTRPQSHRRTLRACLSALLLVAVTGAGQLVAGVQPAGATPVTVWASPSGTPADPCTQAAPCDLDQAVADVTNAGGGIIEVLGTSATPYTGVSISFTVTSAVTLEAAPGAAPVLQGQGTGVVASVVGARGPITISGLDISGGYYGISLGGTGTVVDSYLHNNSTGILSWNGMTFAVNDSTVAYNSIGISTSGPGQIVASTVNQNTQVGIVGGNDGSHLQITSSTIVGNGNFNIQKGAYVDLAGSIVADPVALPTSQASNCSGGVNDLGGNISDDITCWGNGDPASVAPSSTLDASLQGPLTFNGGPTPTIALSARSPAIGLVPGTETTTGGTALCSQPDQRGSARPSAVCDAGAYDTGSATPNQTISFTSTPPSGATVGTTYAVTATGGTSRNPVTFSIDPASTSVCSLSAATVSFTTLGTCTVDANQAGNATYLAAPQAQQAISVVNKGSQAITFDSIDIQGLVGGTYNVTVSGGNSTSPVVLTIDATSTSVCSISGIKVSFNASGQCVIDANQAGDANYLAAPQVQQTVPVAGRPQTITFTSSPPATPTVGETYTVTANGGGSGNPVVFSISGANSQCSISGATVTFTGVGYCIIVANQAGNATYGNAPQNAQEIPSIGIGSQTVTFTSQPPSRAYYGGTYTPTATGGASGNPVVFSSQSPTVCEVLNGTVNFIGIGGCAIYANQAGNANYNAATEVFQTVQVGAAPQTITFPPLPSPVGAGSSYVPFATGGPSGRTVVFSIDSTSTPGACTYDAGHGRVDFTGLGSCVIDANQGATTDYQAAPQAQQTVTVLNGQAVSFTSHPPSPGYVGNTYTATATGGASGNPVVLSVDSTSTPGACSLNTATGVVSFTGNGSCVIDANQAGNATYVAAPEAQQTITVDTLQAQAPLVITSPTAGTFGTMLPLITSGGSGSGALSYAVTNGTASGCAVVATDALSSTSAGTCTVTATKAASPGYLPASSSATTVTFAATAPSAPTGSSVAQRSVVASLGGPAGAAVDGAGTLYLAEYSANQVVKVSPTGSQTTIGTGWQNPNGVAVDVAGDIYVTDSGNHRVEKVSPSGAQSTIGSGFSDPDGVAVDGAGNVYVADYLLHSVSEITPPGAQSKVGSGFTSPQGLAVDGSGNLYVGDLSNGDVVEITSSGAQSVIGTGFDQPEALAVDLAGDVYVASTTSVAEITPSRTTTTVGSGYGTVSGLAADGAGDVFVSDFSNNDVVELYPTPSAIAAGNGSVTVSWKPSLSDGGLPVSSYTVTATDATKAANGGQSCSYTVSSPETDTCMVTGLTGGDAYTFTVTATNGAGTSAPSNPVAGPLMAQAPLTVTSTDGTFGTALALATAGGSDGGAVTYTVTNGTATGCAVSATTPYTLTSTSSGTCSVTATMAGNAAYQPVSSATTTVTLAGAAQAPLLVTSTSGTYGTALPLTTTGGTDGGAVTYTTSNGTATGCAVSAATPYTLSATSAGTCTVTATMAGNADYQPVSSAATTVTLAATAPSAPLGLTSAQMPVGQALSGPAGVARDSSGDLYVAEYTVSQVLKITPSGMQTTVGSGWLHPNGVAVDSVGDVYVTDSGNHRVEKVTPAGAQSTIGSGFSDPDGVAVDGAGNLYVADYNLQSVSEITPAGKKSPVGSGFVRPQGVAVSGSGNVYVGDLSTGTVTKVAASGGQSVIGSGFNQPEALAVDLAGDVYVASTTSVAEIMPSRTTTTVGSGYGTVSGLAADGAGDVFVSDFSKNDMVELGLTPLATSAAAGSATVNWQPPLFNGGLAVSGYTATATDGTNPANGGQSCSYTVSSPETDNCMVTGLTGGDAYTFTVTATNGAGTSAPSNPSNSVSTTTGSQTITYTSTAPTGAVVGGVSYTVTATGGPSGSPVVFSLDTTSSGCALSGATVTFPAAGTCVIDANQAGDANYNPAAQVQQSFAVGQGSQAITFTSTAPTNATVAGSSYTVTATGGGSTSPVVFSLDGTSTGCALRGATVSFPAAGTCVIDANQAGDANYNPAAQVQQSFAVGKGTQTITFTSTAPATASVGGAPYTVTASGGHSTSSVGFSLDSSSTGCALSGATVTFPAAGTCVIDANQAGDANYNPATQIQQSFSVGQGSQAITFTSTAPTGATVGGAPYTVTATGGASGNAVTFSLDGTSTGCVLSGSTVTFSAAGTCVIDANQAGDTNYNPAAQVQQSFNVAAHGLAVTKTTLTLSNSTSTYGKEQSETFRVTVTSKTKGTLSGMVALRSGTTTLCTTILVSGSGHCSPTATALPAGLHSVTASYQGNATFAGSAATAKWRII